MRGLLKRRVRREGHRMIVEGQWCARSLLRMHVIVLRRVDFEGDWG
jgi:hypothetical protein